MSSSATGERRFFILAGETSGDGHGAALMAAMQADDARCVFAGFGGRRMVDEGLDCRVSADRIAMVGFVEVLRHLPLMLRLMKETVDFIRSWQPERVILIDYPGFNLRLAKKVHALGIPVTYYISPQLWAWKENRIKTIRRCVDQMLVIFPFEVDWYAERGVMARFVGHPLLEEPEPAQSRDQFFRQHDLDPSRPVLTLFPGSRKQELERHLTLFHEAAQLVRDARPDVQVILGLAQGLDEGLVPEPVRKNLIICHTAPRTALRYTDLAIVASGTATLEAAVWGIPMVVVYRLAPVSWWLGNLLVDLEHVAMVNILAGKRVVPELLQGAATAPGIKSAVMNILQPQNRANMLAQLAQIRHTLTVDDAQANSLTPSRQTAKAILEAGG